jgi:hypothetical protein
MIRTTSFLLLQGIRNNHQLLENIRPCKGQFREMGEFLGCSGWNYPDTSNKDAWTTVFYPDKDTKRLIVTTILLLID